MKIIQKLNIKLTKNFTGTQQIAASFLMVIFIGAGLLSLPVANRGAIRPFVDNFFIATSATCVTGLTPLTVVEQYTVFGQVVILAMIQIGGLGFMTLLSFMLAKVQRKLALSTRIVLQESLNQKTLNGLGDFVKRILRFTLVVELLGAFALSFQFIPEFGLAKGIYYSVFHSISSFCNAGFDLLGSSSLIGYATNYYVNVVIALLIITGGLGFIVWFELYDSFLKERKRHAKFSLSHYVTHLSVHSKIALSVTGILLFAGAVLTLIIEYNNPGTLGGHNLMDKMLISGFTSVTLRTAGFATIDMASLMPGAKLIFCLFMFIGGSPAGTAGGIKTVTFGLIVLMIVSIYKGHSDVIVFNRRIKKRQVLRAFSIFIIALTLTIMGMFIVFATETQPVINLVFEIFSAFGTVGLSAGVTGGLSEIGKYVIIVLMYVGRIGPITLLISFVKKSNSVYSENKIRYVDDNVLIG
ncbi:MAG: potassium transporter TrkG [Erysipelotrichaceae bacterium]|nr:potassium transporter TrkG [Erysipelotrichaceae bacterium]MDD3810348.1 potassium transporter TrkG [Erysipelotrichaceae bacterium]